MLELVQLVGERLELLHLVVDHLDVLRDFLSRVDDRLNGVSWVVNDPLRARGHDDAERHDRECDYFFHGVPFVMLSFAGGNTPPITRKDLPRGEEDAVYDAHNIQ